MSQAAASTSHLPPTDPHTSSMVPPMVPPSADSDDRVNLRRIFIGPMPERVITLTESQASQKKKLTLGSVFSLTLDPDRQHDAAGDKTDEVARLVKAHAFRIFLTEGGDAARWDRDQEESTVRELMDRWRASEWGRLWRRRQERRMKREGGSAVGGGQWFGTSFEIGNFLGVDVLRGYEHVHAKAARGSEGGAATTTASLAGSSSAPTRPPLANGRSSGQRSSYYSRTDVSSASRYESAFEFLPGDGDESISGEHTPPSSVTGLLRPDGGSGSSAAALQNQKSKSQPNLEVPKLRALHVPPEALRTQSEVPRGAVAKGKAKVVHYAIASSAEDLNGNDRPAPPQKVLMRRRSSLPPNTSSAAAMAALSAVQPLFADTKLVKEDALMRDRMLVRVTYTKQEGIHHFDEEINRTMRNLKYEDWGEFMVAWRKDSIEIYRDHNTPGKEWMTGHKHLSYVIPLLSSKTKLSLFSFVDLTFCITCAPTTTTLNTERSRWNFRREKEGTNIFIFKLKSRSRGYDWIWKLWRAMGGNVPPSVEIYNPRLDTRVTIDIPGLDPSSRNESYAIFSRKNTIDICMDSLHEVPDWKYLMDEQIRNGRSLELAWRSKANVDWIWLENDITGKPREWHVLCGIALRQLAAKPPALEIRVAPHGPFSVKLKDGRRLDEPPSVEGYVDRIKPNSQIKQGTYITAHQGHLYFLNPLTASPPLPPGLNSVGVDDLEAQIEQFRNAEIRRGTSQIMGATSMLDLRAIIAVRRAFHPTSMHTHDERADANDDALVANFMSGEVTTEADEADAGGEEGLGKVHDRSTARMRRSFELLLKTGHVLRFEAHSCRTAVEWITRLRALILYWKHRHRTDAQHEIELAQAQKPRLTPQIKVHCDEEDQPVEQVSDMSAPYPALDSLYSWCVLEGCKPAVKSGRLYMRKGLRGQYKLVQLTLVAGHLIRFRINGNSSMFPAMRKKFNLLDAYVCSGYLAEQCLPKGQYNPNSTPAPRRYQDGLETDDREEDMMFLVWYRSQPQIVDVAQDPTVTPIVSRSIPNLSGKNKLLVFKTRSALERDAWCWAINSEIEKIVRTQQVREERLRETGNLLDLTE